MPKCDEQWSSKPVKSQLCPSATRLKAITSKVSWVLLLWSAAMSGIRVHWESVLVHLWFCSLSSNRSCIIFGISTPVTRICYVCVCHSGTIFVVLRAIDILIHNLIFTAKVPFGSHCYLWKVEGRQPSSFSMFSIWQQWVLDHSSHNSVFCLCPSHWNQPQCMLITQVEMLVGTEYTLLLKFSPLLTSTLSSRLCLWQLCSSSFPTSLFPQFVHL